jgi:hypothetical protein
MVFGNWKVTEEGIEWAAAGEEEFRLHKDDMLSTQRTPLGITLYEYILLATNEEWLSENDLFDFNFAFVYAAAKFGLEFDYQVFDATLAEQYEQFEEEDDEEDGDWTGN